MLMGSNASPPLDATLQPKFDRNFKINENENNFNFNLFKWTDLQTHIQYIVPTYTIQRKRQKQLELIRNMYLK